MKEEKVKEIVCMYESAIAKGMDDIEAVNYVSDVMDTGQSEILSAIDLEYSR